MSLIGKLIVRQLNKYDPKKEEYNVDNRALEIKQGVVRQHEIRDLLIITGVNKISINKYGYSVVVSIENNKATYNSVVIYDMEQDLVSFIDFLETKEEDFLERIYNVDHEKYKQYLESIGVIEYSSEIMYLVADLLMFLNNKNITDEIKKGLVILVCTYINPSYMSHFIKGLFRAYGKNEDFKSYLNGLINHIQQKINAFEEIDFGNIFSSSKVICCRKKTYAIKEERM